MAPSPKNWLLSTGTKVRAHVFSDDMQRRWRWIARAAVALAVVAVAVVAIFVAGLARLPGGAPPRAEPIPERPHPGARAVAAAFFAPSQPGALAALRAHAARLTHLFPLWLKLPARQGDALDRSAWDPTIDPASAEVAGIARAARIAVLPVLGPGEAPDAPEARERLAAEVRDFVVKEGFQGVNVAAGPGGADLLPVLRRALAPRGLLLAATVEAGEAPPDPAECDLVVVMPGAAGAGIPPGKLVTGLACGAQDEIEGSPPAEERRFVEALGLAPDGPRSVTFAAEGPAFDYVDPGGAPHRVRLFDAVLAANEWTLARRRGTCGAALARLGAEDPAIWDFFGPSGLVADPDFAALALVPPGDSVTWAGAGEVIDEVRDAAPGARAIEVDAATGLAARERYTALPAALTLHRAGAQPGLVALTFDDGPSDAWTPRVLDRLQALGVRATFFVVGDNACKRPDLLRRMLAEGHEVGNHTFTHANLAETTDGRAGLELDVTRRSLEAILGRSTRLFRPPYDAGADPEGAADARPLAIAARRGYLAVGNDVDPHDWDLFAPGDGGARRRRTAREIADAVLADVRAGTGSFVLLHDAGGDRAETLAALDLIVSPLRAEGFRFVTTSEMLGRTRDDVMPPVEPGEWRLVRAGHVALDALYFAGRALSALFAAAIALGVLRVGLMSALALLAWRRERRAPPPAPYARKVSVLIAAYNEERVIARTIDSVLTSDHPDFEVIVIDDGSADGTAAAVEAVAARDARVRLLRQPNRGKARALNHGLKACRGEVIVCLDADTLVLPTTVSRLARHFGDPRVGAVAGNVKVGNRTNVLTRWQALEYVTSQNLDRRAQALLDAIAVVPGAAGAWRRDAVGAVGGYLSDTLAEDMDLTWRLHRAGWRIANDCGAYCYTEAPDTTRALFKQRFRWAFGTLQCLWKHKAALFRAGWFGALTLPTLWVFQVGLQSVAPIVDAGVVAGIAGAALGAARGRGCAFEPQSLETLATIAGMYALFLAVEFVGAAIAIRLDKERLGLLRGLVLQRFFYRQLMYAAMAKAILRALRGTRQGWGKLERKNTATSSDEHAAAAPPAAPETAGRGAR
jgi:poly-beta-1,6 N-acetyl-D-glucosamine synthase